MDDTTTTPVQPSGLTDNQDESADGNGVSQTSKIHLTRGGEEDAEQGEDREEDGDSEDEDLDNGCQWYNICPFCEGYLDGLINLRDLDWCGCKRCHRNAVDDGCLMDVTDQLLEHEMAVTDTESVYISGCQAARYTTGLNVDYDRCTIAELRKFTLERGLASPSLPFKAEYIKILVKADRDATFRFMDLPAEMRNEIYEYLLILPGGEPVRNNCHTSILRTCKEIYGEARSILYEGNTVKCAFRIKFVVPFLSDYAVHIHNSVSRGQLDVDEPYTGNAQHILLPNGMDAYPTFLRRISHLRLDIEAQGPNNDSLKIRHCYCLGSMMLTLSSFLMEGHCLRSLEICVNVEFENAFLGSLKAAAQVLYPLQRIRGTAEVRVTGNVPGTIVAKLVEEMQSSEPCFNTVKYWRNLMNEARAIDELLNSLGRGHYYNDVTRDLHHLCYGAEDAFGCREDEEGFRLALDKAAVSLRRVNPEKLQTDLFHLVQVRKDRLRDEESATCGNL